MTYIYIYFVYIFFSGYICEAIILSDAELTGFARESQENREKPSKPENRANRANSENGLCVYSHVFQLTLAYATRMLKQQPPHAVKALALNLFMSSFQHA